MQGRFIVFEGGEGCGKTTQIGQLQAWFHTSGILAQLLASGSLSQLVTTREPGGTDLGREIRHLLLHHTTEAEPMIDRAELLLYAADRAQHVEHILRPHLAAGALILCDRYTDSTVAYQGYGRNLDRDLIDQLNHIATGGLISHLTLWLDVEVETGLERAQRRGTIDRMEKSELEFHQRVRQGFAALADRDPDRVVRVDASPDAKTVALQVQAIVRQRLGEWYGGEW